MFYALCLLGAPVVDGAVYEISRRDPMDPRLVYVRHARDTTTGAQLRFTKYNGQLDERGTRAVARGKGSQPWQQ